MVQQRQQPIGGRASVGNLFQRIFGGPAIDEEGLRRLEAAAALARQQQLLGNPQGGDEPRVAYDLRTALSRPFQAAQSLSPTDLPSRAIGAFGGFIGDALTTPNQARAAAPRPTLPQGATTAPQPAAAFNIAAALPTSASPTNAVFAAMIRQESGGRHWAAPGRPLTSSAGAIGIAQIMPGTGPEAARLAGVPWSPERLRNDPQYNLQLGAAYFNEMLRRFGNVEQAVAAYNAGPAGVQRAVQRGGANWQAFLPRETQGYLASVLGGAGGGPPGMGAWNQYAGAALAEVDAAQALALQPQSFNVDLPPPPGLPEPQHYQAPDFTAGNEAFEASRPRNPFAEPGSETRLLRDNFFRGMAEAMLSIRPGSPVGFGEVLMRAGMGALGGRMRGAEEVRQRMDRYDGLMAQYQQALASRNDQQAVATANVINQNIEQDNTHAYRQAEQAIADHRQRTGYEVQGGVLITRTPGEGNRVQVTTTPIASLIAPQYALQRAQILASGAGAAQQNAQWSYQMAQTMALQYAALGLQQQSMTPQQDAEAVGMVYAQTIMPAVESGQWRSWMSPEVADTVLGNAFSELGVDPLQFQNNPDYRRQIEPRVNAWLTEELVVQALSDPNWGQHILRTRQGTAGRAVQRVRDQRTSTRVTRGRTGVSVSETTTSQYSD